MQGRQHAPDPVVLGCPEGGGYVGVNTKCEAGGRELVVRGANGDA